MKIHRHILQGNCSPESSFQRYITFAGNHPSEGVNVKRPPVTSENLTYNQPQLRNGAR